jgi:hypothetical protein
MPETFHGDLAGNQSCPVELGQQPEARRASAGGNPAGEAKTASAQAVLSSPEITDLWEPSPYDGAGAAPAHRHGLVYSVPPGSKNRA